MSDKRKSNSDDNKSMLFGAWNYKVFFIGFLLVVAGFLAMYLENEVHGFISLYISPIVIMAGYITVIFAIMKHNNSGASPSEQN